MATGTELIDLNGLAIAYSYLKRIVDENTAKIKALLEGGGKLPDGTVTGEDGKGISSIIYYYARSTSSTDVPPSWQTTVPTLTSIYRYLWAYQTITYTDSTQQDTPKGIIGVYGDTGSSASGSTGPAGADGKNGKDGNDGVAYQIVTSVDTITRNLSGTEITPSSITFTAKNNTYSYSGYLYVDYSSNGSSWYGGSGNYGTSRIVYPSSAYYSYSYMRCRLYSNSSMSSLLAQVTIPIQYSTDALNALAAETSTGVYVRGSALTANTVTSMSGDFLKLFAEKIFAQTVTAFSGLYLRQSDSSNYTAKIDYTGMMLRYDADEAETGIGGFGYRINSKTGRGKYLGLKANGSGHFNKVYLSDIYSSESSSNNIDIHQEITYSGCGSATTNNKQLGITASGYVRPYSTSSSKRYKHDIKYILDEHMNPEQLYNLHVAQYVYNSDYLSEDDEGQGQTFLGLIAEDVDKDFPAAAKHNPDGTVESFDDRQILAACVAMIQKQHSEIENLEQRIKALENKISGIEVLSSKIEDKENIPQQKENAEG